MAEPTHEEICKERIARLEGHIIGLQVLCAELLKVTPKVPDLGLHIIPKLETKETVDTLIVKHNLHQITALDRQHFEKGLSAAIRTVHEWAHSTLTVRGFI